MVAPLSTLAPWHPWHRGPPGTLALLVLPQYRIRVEAERALRGWQGGDDGHDAEDDGHGQVGDRIRRVDAVEGQCRAEPRCRRRRGDEPERGASGRDAQPLAQDQPDEIRRPRAER